MQLYWLIFLLSALLPTASSLKLYNATEWKPTGSFMSSSGTTYNVYKPVCPGRYRIGDVVISSDTNPDSGTIAKALVCVSGESSEIVEATAYGGQKLAGTAVLVREVKPTGGGNLTNVLGAVSLPVATWATIPQKGSTTETDELRGYGAIVSSTCKLADCSGIPAILPDAVNGYVFFQLYNALSTMNLSSFGYFLPLFRYAGEPGSDYLNPKCLAPKCFCETTCVHGVCNPNTGGCVCDAGWKGSGCSEDINECDTGIAQCDSVGTCINTAPGYYCTCPGGYTLNSDGYTCDDINECLNATICSSGEICTNYQGGYECNNCAQGKVLVNGVCTDVEIVYSCGNGVLDSGEECDRGLGCNLNCTCSPGFTPKNNTDCSRDCGNGVLNAGEECDSGMGCLDTCLCDTNQGYQPVNSTSCQAVYIETDPCARFNGNCSDCLAFNCLYCNSTNTCATNRISSDCLDQCPGFTDNIIVPPMTESSSPTGSSVDANAAMIQTVVPAVVISVGAAVAGVVVLVVLLKRREKKRAKTQTMRMSLQRSNSRRMTRNQSKYGIERNTINSSPDKFWEPPADSEFEEVDKMPFDMSKKIDFNVGSNQFKVGQQYADVITITAKDKKSATAAGVPFAFHPPTTKKLKMEFNPSSGIVKKGKPVEVEVTMTMQMTTEIDVDIGVECSSEKKHSFITLHLMSELSSFIDLDEVVLEGGSGAKPVGDGAFGVVYKGKYRAQDVAVKMLKMQDMPEEMLDEFDREVDLMNKLRHKNIVQFIGASKVVGRFALITEFIDKGNIANVILNASKTLSYAFKIRVALDAARAMLFLHENKILHRDLKLDNLLCVSTNPDDPVVAKLTDFGTSRAVSEKISNSYTVGVGTPMYMSPEILAKKPYDTKSDVYSYGVMLWILYCQKEPYKNIEHSWEVARFVMEGNREKIPKDCPVEFKELIEQCWAQEPNQRPEFEQIVTRLEQMLQENEEAPVSPRSPRSLSSSMKLKKSLNK